MGRAKGDGFWRTLLLSQKILIRRQKRLQSCLFVRMKTYRFPAIIIRPANNYGPWQYPEKLIPVIILKALKNEKVPVYGKGKQIREWLHVQDCARGIHIILNKGE